MRGGAVNTTVLPPVLLLELELTEMELEITKKAAAYFAKELL